MTARRANPGWPGILATAATLLGGGLAWGAPDGCRTGDDKPAVVTACSAVIGAERAPRALERAHNRRGLAYESLGQLQAAADDFSAVIRLDPKIAGYYDNRQRVYKAMGQLDLALADADAAVRLAPTYSFTYHGRGAVHAAMGLNALAVQDYNAALAINAADAPLLVDRGRALVKLGFSERALADFSSAHGVDPAFMPALRERGMTELQLGRSDAAKADLAAALAGGLKDDDAAAALSHLLGVPPGPRRFAQADDDAATTAAPPAGDALTPTQKAEQEAERQLQAAREAEQARQAAALHLRADRLAFARQSATTALTRATAFVKANRDDPAMLEHLQRIADLSGALPAATEPAEVERKTAALAAGLAADPLFAAFEARTVAERHHEEARDLATANRTLLIQKTVLIGATVQDPTSPLAGTWLSLAKQVDSVVAQADLSRAQTLVGTIDAAIAAAGLRSTYAQAQAAAAAANPPAKAAATQP